MLLQGWGKHRLEWNRPGYSILPLLVSGSNNPDWRRGCNMHPVMGKNNLYQEKYNHFQACSKEKYKFLPECSSWVSSKKV